jgi:hypothetical protein
MNQLPVKRDVFGCCFDFSFFDFWGLLDRCAVVLAPFHQRWQQNFFVCLK